MEKHLLFLLLAGIPLAAQSPVFCSDARVVEVAVVAKDANGVPIGNLRKTDFHVFDNRVEQTIQSFEQSAGLSRTLNGGMNSTVPETLPGGGRTPRRSIIVLDMLNSDLFARVRAKKAISDMLQSLPSGVDSIAIFALGDELHMLHDFSTNTALLREVDLYAELRLARTLQAFTEIAQNMRDVPGEKNLIWMTGGFLPPDDHQDIAAATRDLAASRVTMYPVDARGLIACVGGCGPEVNGNIASMEEIAEQTGGRAYHDSNGIAGQAREALDDSRENYILTYAPSTYRQDGSVHEVSLRTKRKGLDLRYRPSYIAD
jgi:VWFA-related protein